MPAKPTEEQIRTVIAALDEIIEAREEAETGREAYKVKDVLQWVLGEDSGFVKVAVQLILEEAFEEPDQESHSE
jgi:hypothetical protein